MELFISPVKGANSIISCDEMRILFLENHKDYCINHDLKYEIFKLYQKEYESLEDLLEIFVYNVERGKLIQNILIIDLLKNYMHKL